MSENTSPALQIADDLDLDDWLNGGQRKAHTVTLYARADLIADIEALERRRVVETQVQDADTPLGGSDSPNAELDEQITALYLQLDASKKEFRVTSRTEPEIAAIKEQVTIDMREEADEAAARARNAAKELVKRMGTVSAQETNNIIRAKALEASNEVINRETNVRALAESMMMRRGDDWVQLTAAQVHKLHSVLGGSQIDALNRAFSRAANEAPVVTVPKSRKP